ncbi:hypothetical protein ACFRJ1_38290 [Streptomyces sp. NPDC056773]|uniref:hypothetical protein n=1 Tax=unclassified Streptomyces TaxID=2593676 RepID=UPI00369E27EA
MPQTATVASLTHSIALALPDTWQSREVDRSGAQLDHAAFLVHQDGRRLHLSERWDEPGWLQVRGAYPATDYPFRTGDRDSLRIPMAETPERIAQLMAETVIPRHRAVHDQVTSHNAEQETLRRDVETLAHRITDQLPGASTRIHGTLAYVTIGLKPGEVRIGIDGPNVNIVLNDAPPTIADAVVYAVSRFLPNVHSTGQESPDPDDEFSY